MYWTFRRNDPELKILYSLEERIISGQAQIGEKSNKAFEQLRLFGPQGHDHNQADGGRRQSSSNNPCLILTHPPTSNKRYNRDMCSEK